MTVSTDDLRLGILVQAVDEPEEFTELVRTVETRGFETLWVADSSLHARSAYCYLTLAAVHSTDLRLGTGITQPVTRHPAIVANAIATLDEIAGGRVNLGFGSGDRPLLELGLRSARVDDVRGSVDLIRRLLAGETTTMRSRLFEVEDAELVGRAAREVPVYLAASGPRTLALAGEIADGVLVQVGTDPRCISHALEQIRAGAERAGRTIDDLDIAIMAYGSVADDREAARDAARPFAAWVPQTVPAYCEIAGIPPEDVARVREVYAGGELMKADRAASAVTDAMVDAFTLAGTPGECRERLLQIAEETGVSHVAFFPMGDDRLQVIRTFAASVA